MKTNVINLSLWSSVLSLVFFACHPLQWEELPRLDPACPCIHSISPIGASFDELITVEGQAFDANSLDQFTLTIGDKAVSILNIISENRLEFKVPKGIGNGVVRITRTACDASEENCEEVPEFAYHFKAVSASLFAGISGETSVFNSPRGLALDAEGNLIVADRNHHVIQSVNSNGFPTTIAGTLDEGGFENNPIGLIAKFKSPADVAIDPNNGTIYVADETNHSIRSIENNNNHSVSRISGDHLAPSGDNGSFLNASYTRPIGIAIDEDGERLFVTEFSRNRLRLLDMTSSSGLVSTIIGNESGTSSPDGLANPVGVAYSDARNAAFPVYVADKGNQKIRAVNFNAQIMENIPPGSASFLSNPNDMELDFDGNVYITEQSTNNIYAVFADNSVVAIAGPALDTEGSFPFQKPSGIAIDKENMVLYVSDEAKHIIVKITLE